MIKAKKIGNIIYKFNVDGKGTKIDIKNIYYEPDIGNNLLGVSEFRQNDNI